MEHRPAVTADLDRIMEIIGEARGFLKESGLPQWQNGYPERSHFEADIARGFCHVLCIDGRVAGVISVCFTPEADYRSIEAGSWLTEGEDYAVIHRLALANEYRGRRLAHEAISLAETLSGIQGCPSIRVDTYVDNKAMRRLLERSGYQHCGMIYLDGVRVAEEARVCYEKVL